MAVKAALEELFIANVAGGTYTVRSMSSREQVSHTQRVRKFCTFVISQDTRYADTIKFYTIRFAAIYAHADNSVHTVSNMYRQVTPCMFCDKIAVV